MRPRELKVDYIAKKRNVFANNVTKLNINLNLHSLAFAPLYDFCKGTQNFSIFLYRARRSMMTPALLLGIYAMSYERLKYKTFPIYIFNSIYEKKKTFEILYEKFFMNKMVF